MSLEIKLRFRSFEYEKDIAIVCEFHKDHSAINFPDSNYVEDLFKETIKRDLLESPDGLFVLEDNKNPIGFLNLVIRNDPYKNNIKWCDVRYVHLIPEYRGRGLYKLLMAKADEFAKIKGAVELRLGTHAENEQSIQAYLKSGYRIKRVIMEKKFQ